MDLIRIKKNDTGQPMQATLRKVDGSPIPLSGATVRFIMKQRSPGTKTVNGLAEIVNVAGVVRYSWAPTDLDTVGLYQQEWEITFANGKKQTVPSDGYVDLEVITDLG